MIPLLLVCPLTQLCIRESIKNNYPLLSRSAAVDTAKQILLSSVRVAYLWSIVLPA